ncbi:MAG: hypothetical protein QM778_13085 [Myxococcales bacterium]
MDQRRQLLDEIASRHGTPCFVYFMDDVQTRVHSLRAAFQGLFGVSYAMKCNPHPGVVSRLASWVDTLDVSSGGELRIALGLDYPADKISFTGPAKSHEDLELAVEHAIGEVVVESVREARELSRIAQGAGKVQRILVRIAPSRVPKGFGVNMAGRPCQFGIDEEDAHEALSCILDLPGLDLVGFHIYSGTQCLKPDAIAGNYQLFIEIFRTLCEGHRIVPQKLVFGSGFGIPYHDKDRSVDAHAVAELALPQLRAFKAEPRFADTELLLETGRYLVGEAGIYLTRVVNRKRSRGSEIATFDGGMNHHLGACGHLGMALHRNYRLFKVSAQSGTAAGAPRAFDLYGPLCTTIDVLGRGVMLPELQVGDVIGIHCSGAYGVTASPAHFISHDLPVEVIVEGTSPQLVLEISSRKRHGEFARSSGVGACGDARVRPREGEE